MSSSRITTLYRVKAKLFFTSEKDSVCLKVTPLLCLSCLSRQSGYAPALSVMSVQAEWLRPWFVCLFSSAEDLQKHLYLEALNFRFNYYILCVDQLWSS